MAENRVASSEGSDCDSVFDPETAAQDRLRRAPGIPSVNVEEDALPVAIRDADPSDRDAIADLHAASWRSAYRGIVRDDYLDGAVVEDRRVVWRRRFAEPLDPNQIVVLAEPLRGDGADAPLGFCCILAGYDPDWGSLVDNLHVRPGLSRRRMGRGLLEAALLRMPSRHAATPVHLTVLEGNTRAQAAYERWGGRLSERLRKREPDGQLLPIRRYTWPTPGDLLAKLQALP